MASERERTMSMTKREKMSWGSHVSEYQISEKILGQIIDQIR